MKGICVVFLKGSPKLRLFPRDREISGFAASFSQVEEVPGQPAWRQGDGRGRLSESWMTRT